MSTRFGGRNKLGVLLIPALLMVLSMPVMAAHRETRGEAKESDTLGTPLEREVRHQLLMLPFYSVFDDLKFQVEDGGTVVLSGQVVRPVLKSDAAAAVKRVKGVESVVDNIEVLPLSPFDDSIRRREYRSIYGLLGFEKYAIQAVPPIHIIVDNGNVTLVGVVASASDKRLAGIAANQVPNVFHVTNDLTVDAH